MRFATFYFIWGDIMLRTMVFIDFQNFDISYNDYCNRSHIFKKSIDYCLLSKQLNDVLQLSSQVIKTYLFASKPCDQLLTLDSYKKQYEWLCKLKQSNYFEVIEGQQVIRSVDGVNFNINDFKTYTTLEKGTDVNVAVQMLSKGFQNAYDIAILVSGDTDYIPVVESLHNLGKIVVLATLPHQKIEKYKTIIDRHIPIYPNIIDKSEYKHKTTSKSKKSIKVGAKKVENNDFVENQSTIVSKDADDADLDNITE